MSPLVGRSFPDPSSTTFHPVPLRSKAIVTEPPDMVAEAAA
jgi:hypothetical protein